MWLNIARFILKFRLPLLLFLVLFMATMGFIGRNAKIAYKGAKIIPADHPKYMESEAFKEKFGEAGDIFFIGAETDRFFEKDFFLKWQEWSEKLKNIEGISAVISLANAPVIQKDTVAKNFKIETIVRQVPHNQEELDSLKNKLLGLPFYENTLYNQDTSVFIMALTFDKSYLNSKKRFAVTDAIVALADEFSTQNKTKLHYSGLPYIRSVMAKRTNAELELFMYLAVLAAAILLLVLFRSFQAMFFPILVVIGGIFFTMGTIVLLGYEITILTGLIPPLIVVISVPNCVYLINRYHREMLQNKDKTEALQTTVQSIGYTVFFANLTTAIGFSVFSLMRSETMQEFGIVAGINIVVLFCSSIIFIPVILSYLPEPKLAQMKHLSNNSFNILLEKLYNFILKRKKAIEITALIIFVIAAIGISKLHSQSYVFDDVPKNSTYYDDIKFFESNFSGVIPFNVMLDTKKKNGATKGRVLKDVEKIQTIFKEDSLFAKPLSLVEGLKFAKQAYFNGLPKFYELPSRYDKTFILSYISNSKSEKGGDQLLKAFTDSTQQIVRISTQMKDIGTQQIPVVLDSIQAKVAAKIDTSRYNIAYTGSIVMAYVTNQFLINGLINSVLLAFLLIALVIAFIFRSPKMLLVALIPNTIPLAVTAGIMGYAGIPLKPATVLIFSVALGISVDFTIHFLAKYRQEMDKNSNNVAQSIQKAMNETGLSMTYTAVILLFGFLIFMASSFQGTYYLGLLTSITIVVAWTTNLVLLPAILFTIFKK